MNILSRIKSAIRSGGYEVTDHAWEEAQSDDFTIEDIRSAILAGKINKKYTLDPRGTRYKVRGPALDGRSLDVICRFTHTDELRLITVFASTDEA